MRTLDSLGQTLDSLEGRNYGGYKDVRGPWGDAALEVAIDHVQGDPFASPSRIRLTLGASLHQLPADLRDNPRRRKALADLCLRRLAREVGKLERFASGRSGQVLVDAGGFEVLVRSGCAFVGDALQLCVRVGLPAQGRRILGRAAARLLTCSLPAIAAELAWSRHDQAETRRFVNLVEDHGHVQDQLAAQGLVAFVRDGSRLPRAAGHSQAPLEGAIPFESPEPLRVRVSTLHHGELTGMGLPRGVTLITGGGFHGKTTLLSAIARGVDPHVPRDGREWVVTRDDAVKLRSEDGRSVVGVDLSGIIDDLPGPERDTTRFSTTNASGSTSLAAAIVESLEAGAGALLLDEDSCATNLLIRDARMQALVARETITPLIDRVRPLHERRGVSTVLVVGGCGDYLEVADTVILMEDYRASEVTERARAVAAAQPTGRAVAPTLNAIAPLPRRPQLRSFNPRRGRRSKVRARGRRELELGEQTIELGAIEQLVDDSQARAVGAMLAWLHEHGRAGASLGELAEQVLEAIARDGLYAIDPLPELASVRPFELIAAMNRLRSLELLAPS